MRAKSSDYKVSIASRRNYIKQLRNRAKMLNQNFINKYLN